MAAALLSREPMNGNFCFMGEAAVWLIKLNSTCESEASGSILRRPEAPI